MTSPENNDQVVHLSYLISLGFLKAILKTMQWLT